MSQANARSHGVDLNRGMAENRCTLEQVQTLPMRWASYEGSGTFAKKHWRNALSWNCVAYWDEEPTSWPSIIILTVNATQSRARLQQAKLFHIEGVAGSRPLFAMNSLEGGISNRLDVTARFEGYRSDSVVISGTWRDKRKFEEEFMLEGRLTSQGTSAPPTKSDLGASVRCNVQHLSILLERLLARLADCESLTEGETQSFRACVSEYHQGSCGSQSCRPTSCTLRQQHDWLTLWRYRDIRDVLDSPRSGIEEDPPKLRVRAGVETLALKQMRRPGHFNP